MVAAVLRHTEVPFHDPAGDDIVCPYVLVLDPDPVWLRRGNDVNKCAATELSEPLRLLVRVLIEHRRTRFYKSQIAKGHRAHRRLATVTRRIAFIQLS